MLELAAPLRTRARCMASSHRRTVLTLTIVALAWLFAIPPPLAQAAEYRLHRGKLDAFIWTPDDRAPAPWPVIVFSHGVYMCGNQSRFLTEALAGAGYIVIAPNHADAYCRPFDYGFFETSRWALKPAALWSDRDYRDRAEDIRAAIAALHDDPRFIGRTDTSRVGLAGHSLGGYTVLGVGGAWPSWRLPGVKAILAMAPYALPFWNAPGLSNLDAPVMYQAGSLDAVFTSPLIGPGGAYERSPSPKYYVEYADASHYAWLDAGSASKQLIVDHAVGFLDCYVKGATESELLRSRRAGIVDLRRDVQSAQDSAAASGVAA